MHPEERLPCLREDLGQARRGARVRPGDDVGSSGALDERDPLEQVGIEAARPSGGVDLGPIGGHAGSRGHDPARALRKQHVAAAGGGTLGELRRPRRLVGERVAEARGTADPWKRRRSRAATYAGDEDRNQQDQACRRYEDASPSSA